MGRVRCIRSAKLEVITPENEVMNTIFTFGEIYEAKLIELFTDGYLNITLSNGSQINGVHKAVFENMGTKINKIDRAIEETAEVVYAPESQPETNKPIVLTSDVLSEDDEDEEESDYDDLDDYHYYDDALDIEGDE